MQSNSTPTISVPGAAPGRGCNFRTLLHTWSLAFALLWAVSGCSVTQVDGPSIPADTQESACRGCSLNLPERKISKPTESSPLSNASSDANEEQPDPGIKPDSAESQPTTETVVGQPVTPAANSKSIHPEAISAVDNVSEGDIDSQAEVPTRKQAGISPDEVTPHPSQPPADIRHYTVKVGENLYTIARQPFIYADGKLWPLIYRANRDQIKDPRQIYPGQVLNIPRDISDPDKEQARTRAKESPVFFFEGESGTDK
ncbi:MAG: LysM peptidoglycan-binding domain-containing protein [Desulfuromonadaceae bacterium]